MSLTTLLACCAFAGAQVAQYPSPKRGEVTGNDVYVRSGPSANHYPVLKLSAGHRVTILGESGEWYEIQPPEGVFSFISGDYVDTADSKTGIVNGDNVRVRAGSTLSDFASLKYVVQTKLSKGAEVCILDRDPDGFLRIEPPSDVSVWVSRGLVAILDGSDAPTAGGAASGMDAEHRKDIPAEGPRPGAVGEAGDAAESAEEIIRPVPEEGASILASLPPSPARDELMEIDEAVRTELAKPVAKRRLEPLIERYREIAKRDTDTLAQQYARVRSQQLGYMNELVQSVVKLRTLNGEIDTQRRAFLEGRAKIRETLPPIPSALDAQGELRTSALYPSGSLPRRFRLVDTLDGRERTIGYVEIPEDSGIDVDAHIGQFVGVRASAKRLQTGGVNPVPIYIAAELVNLQPSADAASESQK